MKQFYSFVLFLCALTIHSQTICNGNFENGNSTDWTQNTNSGNVTFSDETTDVQEGNTSLRANVITANSFANRIESCNLNLIANHTYEFSFYAKTVSGTARGMRLKLTAISGATNISILDNTYSIYSSTYTPTADITTKFRLSFQDVDTYLVDDVKVTDISYFDCNGDFNGSAYLDNCNVCVEGNSGNTSNCTTILSGTPKNLPNNFYGLNTKNIGNGNFMEDINVLNGAWNKTRAKIYRYPGGTFGNSFNWHTGNTLVDARPPLLNPTVKPQDLVNNLPTGTDILWMANIRLPMPETGYDWRTLSRAELLSQAVLDAKIIDILDGLETFKKAGKAVKYLELGNEFYFLDEEGLGGTHGAFGDNNASDFQGDHFPFDKNPAAYMEQMGQIAAAVKVKYPNIEIAIIKYKFDGNNPEDWNIPVNDAFTNNTAQANTYIDAVTYHWYQKEIYYDNQTANFPAISDENTTKTAFGFAFDYIKDKKNFDIPDIPSGKDLWITEGDIKDTSTDNTWAKAIREAIINTNYALLDKATMFTPHMFQPLFVNFTDNKLTVKGKGADMTFSADEDMTSVQEIDLGGGIFFGQYGGPYNDLQAVRFSSANKDRIVMVNTSSYTYSNLDLSSIMTSSNLFMLERYNTTPWSGITHTENKTAATLNNITLQPYSITIVGQEDLIDGLIDETTIVTNPTADFSDRYVKLYEFGEQQPGSTTTKTLHIKNEAATSITLASNPVSLDEDDVFSVTQPSTLSIDSGGFITFDVTFSPTEVGNYQDKVTITSSNGDTYTFDITGSSCDFCNYDFEKGINIGWLEENANSVNTNYTNAQISNVQEGTTTGKLGVTNVGTTPDYTNAKLTTPKIKLNALFTDLKINIYAKADKLSNSDFKIAVSYFNSSNTEVGINTSSQNVLTTNYQDFEFVDNNVPTNAATFSVELRTGNFADNYYYDNLRISNGASLSTLNTNEISELRTYYFNGHLHIKSSELQTNLNITLYNITGAKVLDLKQPKATPILKIPLELLNAGIYIVSLNNVSNNTTKRVKIAIH